MNTLELFNNIDQNYVALETEQIKSLDQVKLKQYIIDAQTRYIRDHPYDILIYLSDLENKFEFLGRDEFAQYVHIMIDDYYKSEKRCGRKPKDINCLPLLIIYLKYHFEYKHKEIAKILNKSEDATRRLLVRSQNKLKPYFKKCKEFIY